VDDARMGVRRDHDPRHGRGDRALARLLPLVEARRAPARLPAALAATAFYAWRPGVLGPLLAGLAVYMPLHIGLGW